jgi:AraC-like DNA-binding protein
MQARFIAAKPNDRPGNDEGSPRPLSLDFHGGIDHVDKYQREGRGMGSGAPRSSPTVTGLAVKCALRALVKRQLDPQPLLKRAGLSDHDLNDPQVRFPVSNQGRFLQYAADALQDPALGLHLAEASNPRESGLLYYVSSAAKDLWETLSLFLTYSSLVNESLRLSVSRPADGAIAEFRIEGASPQTVRHNTEFWVAMVVKSARQISGRRFRPLRVAFPHSSAGDIDDFKRFFGCQVTFDAPVGQIGFSRESLSLPLLTEDPHLLQVLKPICDAAARARGTAAGSVRESVETEVQRLLPRGGVQLQTIAKALAMSERTLSRRLSAEGTSLSEIVDNVRRSLALQYVGKPGISLGQAAWLLGYEGQTSFTHAFRRWTGKSPSAARRDS